MQVPPIITPTGCLLWMDASGQFFAVDCEIHAELASVDIRGVHRGGEAAFSGPSAAKSKPDCSMDN